ncbi:hypothetical protein K3495_g11972 [Podosphaera aphanis]|nr:hypothetical protein K3495_g11972 [Podosphaera aphanis]
MQNSPLPSKLTLLCDLRKFDPGTKVRFLGCVTEYSTEEAVLTLEHNYPPGNPVKVQLDVNLTLETMKSSHCQSGSWVNVIGYIQSEASSTVYVQAVLIWLLGPSSLDAYERSLELMRSKT